MVVRTGRSSGATTLCTNASLNLRKGDKRIVSKLISFLTAGVLAWCGAVNPFVAFGQAAVRRAADSPPALEGGSFEIAQHGHRVGAASFSIKRTADGFDSTSLVKVAMQGLDYALSKNEELSPMDELRHEQLSATVNGEAVNVVAKPEAAQFLVNISARGKSTATRLDAHQSAVFMPDFDPGALETLLALAIRNNSRDLWVILPKQSGSIEPVQLMTYPDQRGKLNGKEIAVHHLVATIAGTQTDLFSGPENELLQAELPQAGFALVRKGFVLDPLAKPEAPRTE